MTDTEIKTKGLQLLTQHLGDIEAERFTHLFKGNRLITRSGVRTWMKS